jgi:hypothetical protein
MASAVILSACAFFEEAAETVERRLAPPPPRHAVRVLFIPNDADPETLDRSEGAYRILYKNARRAMRKAGLVLGGEQDLPHNLRLPGREAPREQAMLEAARVRAWDYLVLLSCEPLLGFPHGHVEVRTAGEIRILPVQWKGAAAPLRFNSTISRMAGAHPDKGDILSAMADMAPLVGKDVGDELARRVSKLAKRHPPKRGVNATGLAWEGELPDTWRMVRSFRPHATFTPVLAKPVRDRMRKDLGVKRLKPGMVKQDKPASDSQKPAEKGGKSD